MAGGTVFSADASRGPWAWGHPPQNEKSAPNPGKGGLLLVQDPILRLGSWEAGNEH